MDILKKISKILLIFLLAVVLIIGSYVAYLLIDYHRIEDNVELTVEGDGGTGVSTDKEYKIITYNIGFAAYTPEFGFFMDGGNESRAFSKESVIETTDGIIQLLDEEQADFLMIQEVDEDATRSHHVDERRMLQNGLDDYNSVFAINYDSSYLFYPFNEPHGKSLSGLLFMSKYKVTSSLRRSLPIENSLMKFVDLDRCYSVSRVPVDNGLEIVFYTVHLSAYTSDGTIANKQLEMLIEDMQSEYEAGNYIICGGDFNKDLLGDSSEYFGASVENYVWAQEFPTELLDGTAFSIITSLDKDNPLPTCRNADAPYHEGQFVLTVDGFIVSDNVTATGSKVINGDFIYSDHNPVYMTFKLENKD